MSMNKDEIAAKITELVAEQLAVKEEELRPEMSFTDDLNADSLDVVEMVMRMEEVFDIEIEDDDAAEIQTVGSAIEYALKRLEA
ncbi:MAG: acyl carrier protein [Gammaproteobacteria bacterium]